MARTDPDRQAEWERFSAHMEKYIGGTVPKYGIHGQGVDLMSIIADPRICLWNILKYSMRVWNGHGKPKDLEKIAHYAQMAWTMLDKGSRR